MKINAVIFIGLKKVFVTADHKVLLSKLDFYGISGNSLEWFQSYLENRIQCSVGSLSDSRVLTCGVPQGTILGPLLFLPYINDLSNCLSHCEPRMYVDDTHLIYADNEVGSIESCLSEDLLDVHTCTWLNANKLTLC